MAFVVVYDACVLYPAPLRDTLIRLALSGIVQVKWSTTILDEMSRNILKNRPDLRAEQLQRTCELMNRHVPDALVEGYEGLIPGLKLPDPGDRHVLAAAIRCSAQTIVTLNLKDFPGEVLASFDLEAMHPDEFVRDLIDLNANAVLGVLHEQAADLKNPPRTLSDVLMALEKTGLVRTVAEVQSLLM